MENTENTDNMENMDKMENINQMILMEPLEKNDNMYALGDNYHRSVLAD